MMLEFELVDRALTKPWTCVCGSATGPMARTFFERWGEDIYLCLSCTKRAARTQGLLKGKKLDELSNAAVVLANAEQEIVAKDARIAELEADAKAAQSMLDELRVRGEHLSGRCAQLEARIADDARAALELVGGAA